MPENISRVFLNLFNNAYYAVNEKMKLGIPQYPPAVQITTTKLDGKIEIKVADIGKGISPTIVGKFFQPFFITNPTGLGTGLGLS